MVHKLVQKKLIGRMPSLHHEHASYKWWVLLNIMIGTFIAVLDSTIVNVGLPKIMASFGSSIDKIEWVLTAYLLAFGIVLPASGWVADHWGYKRTYFGSLFLFTLGSFLCGLSWNEDVLIISRIVQGIGAGFLMPVGMAITMREFPVKQRGLALGFWGISAAASVSFGPLIGGYLIDNFSWQSIFDVNVPIGIFAMFATLVIQREYRTERVRAFDGFGFVSMSVFLTFLLLALSEGNAGWNTGGWSSGFIVSCFALAAAGLTVFLIAELTVKDPFVDLSIFKDSHFAYCNLALFIFGFSMFGSTFLLPLYLQNSLNYTALQAGAVFLPVGILQGICSPIAGMMSDRMGARVPTITGIVFLGMSFYLNNFLSLFSEHVQIMVPLYMRGVALGLIFTPLGSAALARVDKHKIAQASGLFNVVRQVGGSFGVAVFGAMLTRRAIYHAQLYGEAAGRNADIFQVAVNGVARFAQYADGSNMQKAVTQAQALIAGHIQQQAFVQAVDDIFFVAAVISVLGIIPMLLVKSAPHDTGHAAPPPAE